MAGGRPKNIETPDEMWEHFQYYVASIKGMPILIKDWVGKDGIITIFLFRF